MKFKKKKKKGEWKQVMSSDGSQTVSAVYWLFSITHLEPLMQPAKHQGRTSFSGSELMLFCGQQLKTKDVLLYALTPEKPHPFDRRGAIPCFFTA